MTDVQSVPRRHALFHIRNALSAAFPDATFAVAVEKALGGDRYIIRWTGEPDEGEVHRLACALSSPYVYVVCEHDDGM